MTEQQLRGTQHNRTQNKKMIGILVLSVLGCLMLGGCDNFFDKVADLLRINGTAEAQVSRDQDRVQIESVVLNEFNIRVDNDESLSPTTEVKEGFIIFTMQSDGEILGANFDNLQSGDQVILQPRSDGTSGTVTVIYSLPSSS